MLALSGYGLRILYILVALMARDVTEEPGAGPPPVTLPDPGRILHSLTTKHRERFVTMDQATSGSTLTLRRHLWG